MRTDLAQWGPAVVAGNLPYYITSPILSRVFASRQAWTRAVFLVQAEVARRLAADPGSRDYGYLSVLAQVHARVEVLFEVPRLAFKPPPKVDSAVVRLTPRGLETGGAADFGIADPAAFLALRLGLFPPQRARPCATTCARRIPLKLGRRAAGGGDCAPNSWESHSWRTSCAAAAIPSWDRRLSRAYSPGASASAKS